MTEPVTTQEKITRLAMLAEHLNLHAAGDGWTTVDLTHQSVGLTVVWRAGGSYECQAGTLDVALDRAWENRPTDPFEKQRLGIAGP